MKNAWLIYINISSEKGTLQSKLIMRVLGVLTGIQTNIFKTDVFFGRLSDSLSLLLLLRDKKRPVYKRPHPLTSLSYSMCTEDSVAPHINNSSACSITR